MHRQETAAVLIGVAGRAMPGASSRVTSDVHVTGG